MTMLAEGMVLKLLERLLTASGRLVTSTRGREATRWSKEVCDGDERGVGRESEPRVDRESEEIDWTESTRALPAEETDVTEGQGIRELSR